MFDSDLVVYVDVLLYENDNLVFIPDIVFLGFSPDYNFSKDILEFVIDFCDKSNVEILSNISFELSFGTYKSYKEFIEDIPSETLDKVIFEIVNHE